MAAQPFGVDDARTIEALDAYVKLLRAGRAVLARVEPRLTAEWSYDDAVLLECWRRCCTKVR